MSGWARGREEILGMLERRELSEVTANSELAERLLATQPDLGRRTRFASGRRCHRFKSGHPDQVFPGQRVFL
jgi:hypothetical protein